MFVKQLSVFLENKSGSLAGFTNCWVIKGLI